VLLKYLLMFSKSNSRPGSSIFRSLKLATPLALLISTAWLAFGEKKSAPEPAKVGWIEPVQQNIEGWTVHVDPALLKDGGHAGEGKKALKMLANHLQRISILLPEGPLEKMKKMEIWIEHEHPELSAMQYHPGAGWLKDRGYDPRLAKKVHITKAAQLYSREQLLKHPAVILHELAHAYHDQVLSFDDKEIIAAYDDAMKKGILESVQLFTGRNARHYAATNHKEYFAEATEAYLYRNDFYPFVAAELRDHDPGAFEVMKKIWGPAAVK
jgi:dipeptidyl-peptidase-4